MRSDMYKIYFREELHSWGYDSNGEFMEELYLALDVILDLAQELTEQQKGSLTEILTPGMERETAAERLQCRAEIEKIEEHIRERLAESGPVVYFPFLKFAESMELTGWQMFCLLLGSACARERRYETMFARLNQKAGEGYVTKALAMNLYILIGGARQEAYDSLLFEEEFFDICFEQNAASRAQSMLEEPLVLKKRLLGFFWGQKGNVEPNGLFTYYQGQESYQEREQTPFPGSKTEEMLRMMTAKERPDVIFLQGREGSGRKFLVREISSRLRQPILFVAFDNLQRSELPEKIYRLIYLELLLESAVLCVTDWPKEKEEAGSPGKPEKNAGLISLLNYMKRREEMVLVTTEGRLSKQVGMNIKSAELMFAELDSMERSRVWDFFLKKETGDGELDTKALGSRYVLNTGEIKQVAESAEFYRIQEGRERLTEQDIVKALRQYNANRLSGYAQLLEASYSWEDMVIAQETEELLTSVCDRMKYRGQVGDTWGFYGKANYGKGICALFYGPPGTGKTMAAQVLANELGLDLYRIDLSRMMSKYIGETEKNISELFERAKNINALLFFDEADAFFSKRTQVNDSHDRNANGEVAHLLQKLEEYDGISVLATNLKDNMDDAFKRRIKYMIPFPFPDAETRKCLWKKMLPAQMPVEEELRLCWFAEHFELAGSEIREVLMQAAVLAAGRGTGMRNSYIARALQLCLAKYGRVVTEEELDYLL